MAVMQSIFRDNEFALGFKDDEIRVIASGNTALARVAASKASRPSCHPARQIEQRESALVGLGPHQRQGYGKARNSAPRGAEIAFLQTLHRLADRASGR